jgi:cobalt-zinc-cadmium resistance protein CzcA
LAKANIKAGEFEKAITENELIKEIKLTWYQLAYLMDRNKLLLYQDSMYVKFLKAAELRYQTEAGTLLEKVTAESKVTAIKAIIAQNEADIKSYKKRLQTLLNSPNPVDIIDDFNSKKELKLTLDTAIIANNPNLGYLTNLITVREKEKSLNKAQFLPDFSIGYFNQSLIGNYTINGTDQFFGSSQRFTGLQATISIPLWAKPDLARIKAAKLNQQKAETEADYYQTVLLGEYERVVQDYLKYKYTLETYETNALPQAELILSNATKSFEGGAIDYVEYIQGLNNGLEIKNTYLAILNQYNQSIIAIEYLAGR